MIGSDQVDPSHEQQIINKEVVSLTFWLWHIIFIPDTALITSCFSHYLLSVLKSKRVWQPLELPISSITAHLRMTEGCEHWGKGGGGRGARAPEVSPSQRWHPETKELLCEGQDVEKGLTWKVQHNSPVWREELLILNEESLFWLLLGLAALLSGSASSHCQKPRGLKIKQAQSRQCN